MTAARSADSVAAVSNYLQTLVSKLGISQSSAMKESNDMSRIIDILVQFRSEIRNSAIAKDTKDIESLKACDNVRKSLLDCGVDIRVREIEFN